MNFAPSQFNSKRLMKSTEKVQLITGSFPPMEAKELLLNLFGSEIQFYTIKNFSSEVCTGKPDRDSQEKVLKLRGTREKISNLLEEANAKNLLVEIQSSIVISCREKST